MFKFRSICRFTTFIIAASIWLAGLVHAQSSSAFGDKAKQRSIACSLVDDPHKAVYYSGIFIGYDDKLHLYEKAFSTHLEMTNYKVIGTAKCSSYLQPPAAKAGLESLKENWHWLYKTSVDTGWIYASNSPFGKP